jgi:hypothetical protein
MKRRRVNPAEPRWVNRLENAHVHVFSFLIPILTVAINSDHFTII